MRPLINIYSDIFLAVAGLHVFFSRRRKRAGINAMETVKLIMTFTNTSQ